MRMRDKDAAIYLSTAMIIAATAGWVIGAIITYVGAWS